MIKSFLIVLFLASAVEAGTHIMRGDNAGGDLTGTYPNPTVLSSAKGSSVYAASSTASFPFGFFVSTLTATAFNATTSSLTITGSSGLDISGGSFASMFLIPGTFVTQPQIYPSSTLMGLGGSSGAPAITVGNIGTVGNGINAGSGVFQAGTLGISANGSYFSISSSVTIITNTTGSYEQAWSTTTSFYHVAISTSGHFITGGQSPTISSCGSTPSGSIVGDDNQGTISIGGGSVTACTLTFANPWGTTPVCVITDNSTTIPGDISSISQTGFTTSFSLSLGGGLVWYQCSCSGSSCR